MALTGRRTWAAIATMALGLGLALAAARLAPLPGPPLYDGVFQPEPYQWLDPPPGHLGGAQGATATIPVKGTTSPLVAVATPPENSPQAEIFAPPGALVMPAGTTSLSVSIQPVEPTVQPLDSHIDGNVYRLTIVTQTGAPVSIGPSSEFSLVLEDPDPSTSVATMGHLSGGTWQQLKTANAGLGATFLAVITELGDFALLQPGAAASPAAPEASPSVPGESEETTAGPSPTASGQGSGSGIPTVTVLAGIAIALLLLGLLVVAIFPRRHPRRRPVDRPPPRTRR